MAAVEQITSFQNPKVKLFSKLRDKRGREQEKRFVIDDRRDLQRALNCGFTLDYAFYCPALADAEDAALLKTLNNQHVYAVQRDLMAKVSYRESPSAWVAVLHQRPIPHYGDLTPQRAPLVLTLVNLQKPGNIGALLRTADAAGFSTIFFVDTALDLYNPNIIRSSTGASFLNNIYTLTTEQALEFFKRYNYHIAAAYVDAAHDLYNSQFEMPLAIVLGTEDTGLPPIWAEHADSRLRIPMIGQLSDSLNVSVSGAVILYEVLRQQRYKSSMV